MAHIIYNVIMSNRFRFPWHRAIWVSVFGRRKKERDIRVPGRENSRARIKLSVAWGRSTVYMYVTEHNISGTPPCNVSDNCQTDIAKVSPSRLRHA